MLKGVQKQSKPLARLLKTRGMLFIIVFFYLRSDVACLVSFLIYSILGLRSGGNGSDFAPKYDFGG